MSKIGVKPVIILPGVTVEISGNSLLIKGSLGEIVLPFPQGITFKINDQEVMVSRNSEEKKVKSLHGTYARLLSNAITGVSKGFTKTLEVIGTGYKAEMQGEELVLALGYSHLVKFKAPVGISLQVKENNKVDVTGIDRGLVGLTADRITRLRRPDPYKGKGIRYLGQVIKLKPGKAAAKATK